MPSIFASGLKMGRRASGKLIVCFSPWLYQGVGGRMIHPFGFHNRRQQWGKKGAKKEYRKEGRKLIVLRIYYLSGPSKFSKSGFSNTWTINFQMFKLDLEKTEEPDIKLPTSAGSLKKQESSRKPSPSASLTVPKPLTVWIIANRKILKGMGIPDHFMPLEKPVCRSGSNS